MEILIRKSVYLVHQAVYFVLVQDKKIALLCMENLNSYSNHPLIV